jgi:hypothetical protein
MSGLTPRSGRTPATRRAREQRAYRLVVAGGGSAAVGVVGVVLALVGVIGYGLPILALIVAAVCALAFRRTVSP